MKLNVRNCRNKTNCLSSEAVLLLLQVTQISFSSQERSTLATYGTGTSKTKAFSFSLDSQSVECSLWLAASLD